MVRRGWGGSTAAALGVAAGAGAAQLGFGYGLGIINWVPDGAVRAEAAWVASLAWATWIAATSVIVGAVCAQRLRGGDDESPGTLPRLGLALAAGVGAIVTVLLVAVPARAARVPDVSSPQAVAAAYAGAGLVLGVLLAVWALHTRAAATNLIATTGWLWLLAVVSVVDGVIAGRGLTTAQLGIWQISADRGAFWIRDYFYWPGALLSVLSALVIGLVAARRAARTPEIRVGAAASGAAGPLLVALAYLLAVPRLAGIAAEQLSAHLIAPYAVIAGVGGSMVMAALAQRAERRSAERVTVPRQRTGEPDPVDGEPASTGENTAEPGGEPTPDDATRPTGSASGTSASGRSSRSAPDPLAGSSGDGMAEGEPGAASGRTETERGRATRSTTGRRGRAVPPQRQPDASEQAAPAGPRDKGANADETSPQSTTQGDSASPAGSPDQADPPPPAESTPRRRR
ncbi:hypothetical protein AB0N38_12785 [Micromonospora aurantiaca]|uniref:hypothetical protein n=1 Tax=Micromonospora aurantiaca (nom. illeg.) TaxID=47850 RepID=UPI00082842B1|nr:hypothetical protein [Micromonospora aurantiaca]SCL39397.1 hypothetical protein GA0070615_4032 [Micromonospora aurantiaca]